MRYEVTTAVDAPADLVWRTVSDVETWPDWTPRTMLSVRRLDDGPLRVGSRAEVRQPRQATRTWTVTELTEGHSFTWVSTGPGLRFTADHVVADGNLTLAFVVAGPLAPVARLVAGKAIRWAIGVEAASLEEWCGRTTR
jgi:polyketide cyclase/dehydrase/lipid transport protein